MYAVWLDRYVGQERLGRHVEVALSVAWRNRTLVAPEDVDAAPLNPRPPRARGIREQFVETAGGLAAGETNDHAIARLERRPRQRCEAVRRGCGQRFLIFQDRDLCHRRPLRARRSSASTGPQDSGA